METRKPPDYPEREIVPSRHQPQDASHPVENSAWESLGDGYWLPHRIRGSNRGRALG